MQNYVSISALTDLFTTGRETGAFIRLTSLNGETEAFLSRYAEAAKMSGALIEGRLPNPSGEELGAYARAAGQDYRTDPAFLQDALAKWLPDTEGAVRACLAASLYGTLQSMAAAGKTEGMLKNACVKFMCWMRFRFGNALAHMDREMPKILFQGSVSLNELQMLSILCGAGCDIVLIQENGGADYARHDPQNSLSELWNVPDGMPVPADFSIMKLKPAVQSAPETHVPHLKLDRIQIPETPGPEAPKPPAMHVQLGMRPRPQQAPAATSAPALKLAYPDCGYDIVPNTWSRDRAMDRVAQPAAGRGGQDNEIRTSFAQIFGVEDRSSFVTDLIALRGKLEQSGRKLLILEEEELPVPTMDEIARIRRMPYNSFEAMITGLSDNLRMGISNALEPLAVRAFMQVMAEEAAQPGAKLNRLINTGVYLLCWFKRYYAKLLTGWKPRQVACLIRMGGCADAKEALFLRMLARMPVDVLLLVPDLNDGSVLQDPLLQEDRFPESLNLKRFPDMNDAARVMTPAAHAEQDLEELRTGSGMYASHQFEVARTLELSTTIDEISLYWESDLQFRPGFATVNGTVMMPVICAQLCGVKDRRARDYWKQIKRLMTPETYVVQGFPNIKEAIPSEPYVRFVRNGRIDRDALITSPVYPFARLRQAMQDHLLDKLQQLIDSEMIRGTHRSGTEYSIIATVMTINKDILRLIQQFDFTRKNPKLLCVHTGESVASREDTIMMAFLHLIGFDIVCFIPTGYNCFSQWLVKNPIQEHQLGEYMYDLMMPDFNQVSTFSLFRR